MNTIESNKLIAIFLGYIDNGDNEGFLIHPETNYDHHIEDYDWFLYHKSWDWLMPAVAKAIDFLKGNNFNKFAEVRIEFNANLYLGLLTNDISRVYNEISHFAQWHNKQNKD